MNNNTLITLSLISALCMASLTAANASIHAVNSTSSAPTVVKANVQSPVKFASVWADKDSATHVAQCRIEGLDYKSYMPPSAPQWIGISSDDVESIAYAVLPPGYVGTWHLAPRAGAAVGGHAVG